MSTSLDEARREVKCLARLVRTQDAEAARRAFGWRISERSNNRARLINAVIRLETLEATQEQEARAEA